MNFGITTRILNCPKLCGQHKKGNTGEKNKDLGGVAQRKRRHSSLYLDALMIVKIDKIIN